MLRRALPFLAIALTLLGLAASAASLADSLSPAPTFCAETGCETVRATAWARPLGVPLPIIGVGFFATMLALSLLDMPRARGAFAIAGGLGALGLVGAQAFVIGAFCKLCLVADGSALAIAGLVLAMRARPSLVWPSPGRTPGFGAMAAATLLLGALAIAAPLALSSPPSPPPAPPSGPALPEVIVREQRPGQTTIVDFIDFECPFCRALHTRLTAAIARSNADVRVVRKMVPLARHDGALPAAIAWCCAEKQGKGDAMADALVAAPTSELTPAGCEAIAASIGCDMEQYRRDAASAEVRARIDRDVADARAAGVRSLPTIYIDAHAFVGAAATVEDLVAAITQPQSPAQ